MSQSVKKVFIVLITIVLCVVLGTFVLSVLMPNATVGIVNATEDMIFKATGMSFDFNNDGNTGSSNTNNKYTDSNGSETGKVSDLNPDVEGFK